MSILHVHAGALADCVARLVHARPRITYERAEGIGKVGDLAGTKPEDIKGGLDCSGYVQYVIFRTTIDRTRIPQGSFYQRRWMEKQRMQEVDYGTEGGMRDDYLRIAFRSAVRSGGVRTKIGHVWLVINGRTYECTEKLGNDGPASLDWEIRRGEGDRCFRLGPVPGFLSVQLSRTPGAAIASML